MDQQLIEVLEKIERQLHSIKNHLFGIILALGAIIGILINN